MKFLPKENVFLYSTLLILFVFIFVAEACFAYDDPDLMREIQILNVRNTSRVDLHNPFSTISKTPREVGLPQGWIQARPEDFPNWNDGFLQGWKKEFGPGIFCGIMLGVRRYTAWVPETREFLAMISDSMVENGAETMPFQSPYSTLFDLGINSGRIIQRNWSLGEVVASGPGNGLVINGPERFPIRTTSRVIIQPRYTNIYFVYMSSPADVEGNILRETEYFRQNLRIDVSKIPPDPVLNCYIPDDKKRFTLSELLSSVSVDFNKKNMNYSEMNQPTDNHLKNPLACLPIVDEIH